MCQLQAGDEVLTVNRHQVAKMSYTDWKSCMEEALQEGSLVMDIRRHGKNSESSVRAGVRAGMRACEIKLNHTKWLHSWTDSPTYAAGVAKQF